MIMQLYEDVTVMHQKYTTNCILRHHVNLLLLAVNMTHASMATLNATESLFLVESSSKKLRAPF